MAVIPINDESPFITYLKMSWVYVYPLLTSLFQTITTRPLDLWHSPPDIATVALTLLIICTTTYLFIRTTRFLLALVVSLFTTLFYISLVSFLVWAYVRGIGGLKEDLQYFFTDYHQSFEDYVGQASRIQNTVAGMVQEQVWPMAKLQFEQWSEVIANGGGSRSRFVSTVAPVKTATRGWRQY